MIPVVEVKVNGILVGHAIVDDFFNKYGNCDGKNIVGLVAEAHFVNKLRSMGYNVRLLLSHNVEIIRVEHEHFSYECPRGYGEALEHMPDELKAIVKELCENGINIKVENGEGVPAYLEGMVLFKISFKDMLFRIISKYRSKYLTRLMIFDPKSEPFLMALSYELILLLEYASKMPVLSLQHSRIKQLLDHVETILRHHGLRLERDYCYGLKISNDNELIREFSKLNIG